MHICLRDRGCGEHPGLSRALYLQEGKRNAKLRAHAVARILSAVIVREGGRSSTPETLMIGPIGRGVPGRPVEPGDDSGGNVTIFAKLEPVITRRSACISGSLIPLW
jgi:hypothetical protein